MKKTDYEKWHKVERKRCEMVDYIIGIASQLGLFTVRTMNNPFLWYRISSAKLR